MRTRLQDHRRRGDAGAAAQRVGIVYVSNTSLHGAANRRLLTIIDALTAFGSTVAGSVTR